MYIIEDVCYAGALVQGIKILKVQPLLGRMMLITFSTGETRLLDTTRLKGKAFEVLDDHAVFSNPIVFHGVITWQDGNVDLSPEAAYELSYEYSLPVDAARGSERLDSGDLKGAGSA